MRAAALHALPSECFATPAGEGWRPLTTGAAAHWLAHELGVRAPHGRPACAAGFALERDDLIGSRQPVRGPPRAGDLWLDLDPERCGVVASVRPDPDRGFAIAIRHLHPLPARPATGDFYLQFAARGQFFR